MLAISIRSGVKTQEVGVPKVDSFASKAPGAAHSLRSERSAFCTAVYCKTWGFYSRIFLTKAQSCH